MPSHCMPQTIKLQGRASRKTGKQKLNTLLLPTREVIKDSTGASKNCKVTVDQAHRTLDGVCLNWNEQYYLVYQCLSMFIHVYPCLSMFICLSLFTCHTRTALCYLPKNMPKSAESAPNFYQPRILGQALIAIPNGPFLRTLMALTCV